MQNIECDNAKYVFKAISGTNMADVNINDMSEEQINQLATLGMIEEIDELKKSNRQLAEDAEMFKDNFNELEAEYFDMKEKYENLLKYAPVGYHFKPVQSQHDNIDEYHTISILDRNFKEYENVIYIKASTNDMPIWQTYDLAEKIFDMLRQGDIANFKDVKVEDSIYYEYNDYDEYW